MRVVCIKDNSFGIKKGEVCGFGIYQNKADSYEVVDGHGRKIDIPKIEFGNVFSFDTPQDGKYRYQDPFRICIEHLFL